MSEETRALTTWDPFQAMDRLDDEAIVAELEGRVIGVLVYEYRQDQQMVRGLSKAGVDAVCREMAKQGEVLRELSLDWQDGERDAFFKAQVGRYSVQTDKTTGEIRELLLDTAFGVKRQPKLYPKGGLNPHWFEQGASKALRNGKRRLIREDLAQEIIELATKKPTQIRRVEPAPTEAPQRTQERRTDADRPAMVESDSDERWRRWQALRKEAAKLKLPIGPDFALPMEREHLDVAGAALKATVDAVKAQRDKEAIDADFAASTDADPATLASPDDLAAYADSFRHAMALGLDSADWELAGSIKQKDLTDAQRRIEDAIAQAEQAPAGAAT